MDREWEWFNSDDFHDGLTFVEMVAAWFAQEYPEVRLDEVKFISGAPTNPHLIDYAIFVQFHHEDGVKGRAMAHLQFLELREVLGSDLFRASPDIIGHQIEQELLLRLKQAMS